VCGHIFYTGCVGEGAHKVQGPSGDGYTGLHGECLVCVDERGGDEPPESCHGTCDALVAEAGDSTLVPKYAEALQLATAGDADALAKLIDELPNYVKLNEDRGTVQLFDCKGSEVIANLRLESLN
jgi:hypothetical protein